MTQVPFTQIKTDELKGKVKRAYTEILEGQIHYRFQGIGETVLLLHMAGSSSDEFSRMIPLLSKSYKILAPDLLGFGESDMPPRAYEIPDYARSVLSFMDALHVEKAHVLGHHAAALIAVEMAVTFPNRVQSLMLSAMPCSRDPAERLARLDARYMQPVEVSWDGSHLMEYWARANRFGESVQVCNERALDYFKAGLRGEEMHWAGAKYHVLPKLSSIACPTMLLCGNKDWLLPGSDIAKEEMPRSKFVLIDGGTVIMNREIPKEVAAAVLSFLDTLQA